MKMCTILSKKTSQFEAVKRFLNILVGFTRSFNIWKKSNKIKCSNEHSLTFSSNVKSSERDKHIFNISKWWIVEHFKF